MHCIVQFIYGVNQPLSGKLLSVKDHIDMEEGFATFENVMTLRCASHGKVPDYSWLHSLKIK